MSMSILESVADVSASKYDSIDANMAINELAQIQEEASKMVEPIKFTPDMVPVVEYVGEDTLYCIDDQSFRRMVKENDMTIGQGIETMREQVGKPDARLCMVIKECDLDQLRDTIMKDAGKMSLRTEAVNKHIKYIKDLAEANCEIVLAND